MQEAGHPDCGRSDPVYGPRESELAFPQKVLNIVLP